MNDIRQRVWTYLAQSDVPRSIAEVKAEVNCSLASAVDACHWWYDQNELWRWVRDTSAENDLTIFYTIKDRI